MTKFSLATRAGFAIKVRDTGEANTMFSDTDILALEVAITYSELEKCISKLPKEIQENILTRVRGLGIRCVGETAFDAALASVPKA